MPPPYELHKKKMVKFVSLNYKHVFSFEYLYERLHEWLIDEGYMTTSDDKWIEKLYLERVSGNGAKQIWVWWRTDKMWPGGFIKYYFDIDFHVLGLTSAEIVHEGNKVKTDKGECEVFVTAYMEIDPSKGWDTNILLKNEYLRNFFLNRIYKAKIEEAEDNLIKDTSRLLGAVKQYFQLESFIPEYAEKPF
ncbi:TPA: hypothetical protein HA265_07145, partial [Candidatus Woesearchaeota archaeon]|nr:hypothetical protein [Candidatus Woesearchaeota archaeon]